MSASATRESGLLRGRHQSKQSVAGMAARQSLRSKLGLDDAVDGIASIDPVVVVN